MTSIPAASHDAHRSRVIDILSHLAVEQLRCFRIVADQRRVVNVSPEGLGDVWSETTDELWIDIQECEPRNFHELLDVLDLHPLIREDCLDPNRSSRFSSYEASLHFEVPILSDDSIDDYLSVICVPRMLVTIRTSEVPEMDHLIADLDEHAQLSEGTKAAVLYTLLDGLTNRLVLAAGRARDEIRRLARTMDKRPGDVEVDEIVAIKRRLQDITTVAEDQLYCIGALVPVDSQAFTISRQRDYLRDATRTYESALRVLHRYEVRAAEVYQQYSSSLQANTESRLRILTVLSAIYLPLTLIAGIYGMNFSQMPELKAPWAYPTTLALMVLIAVGQLWFFHRRGWFG